MTQPSTPRHSRAGLYGPFILVLIALAVYIGNTRLIDNVLLQCPD